MPFRTPPGAPRDLLSLIDGELRDRIEEAVDHGCLEAIVAARRARGTTLPKADDVRDREEFTAAVRALLERLRDDIPAAAADGAMHAANAAAPPVMSGADRTSAGMPGSDAPTDGEWRLLSLQVARAKALPDYWQQFDAVRLRFTADYVASGGARRGVLGRLFGRS